MSSSYKFHWIQIECPFCHRTLKFPVLNGQKIVDLHYECLCKNKMIIDNDQLVFPKLTVQEWNPSKRGSNDNR